MTRKELIEQGYLEIIGVDYEGDEIIRLTDKFFDENPHIIEESQMFDSDILASIWFKGFIDLKMGEDSEMYISLTDKSENWIRSKELTRKEKSMMYDIISYLNRKV